MKMSHILLLLGLLFLVGLAGCGGDNDTASEEGKETAKVEEAKASSPTELADAAFAIYIDAYDKIVAMADNPPSLADAKAMLEPLKEEMITKLVAIGKQRLSLDDMANKTYNSALMSSMMKISQDKANKFFEVTKHYREEDNDFANVIASFNIITQYADFELLKKQEPEEAARLY